MSSYDTILDEAFRAYNDGQYERAEGLAREVLTAQPAHGDALFLLGLVAYQAGALEPAEELLFQAVKLYPDIVNYRLMLASVLQKQGRLEEALTQYRKVPDQAQSRAQQGYIYLLKRQTDFAESAFEAALKIQPGLPEARLGLLLCRPDITALEALANETNLPDAWYHLARLYHAAGQNEEASAAIQKTGLAQEEYRVLEGVILESLGRDDVAKGVYQAILARNPYRADVLCNMGNIYRRQGEVQAAEDSYKKALAINKNDGPAHQNLADLLVGENRVAEALEHYRALVQINPNDAITLYNLAVVLERAGEWEDALGLYFKLLFRSDFTKRLDWQIADTLGALAGRDKAGLKLARDFAKGWLKNQPDNLAAKHTYAALNGEKETDISACIQQFYDDFAASYDDKMRLLETQALSEIQKLLPAKLMGQVLDLGCGTGAFGTLMQGKIDHLTGVDLSEKMLALAAKTGSYETLKQAEIGHFLSHNKKKYDWVVCVEVIPYLLKIDDFFESVFDHLKKNGMFAFSVETGAQDCALSYAGRYVYSEKYIQKLLDKTGFEIQTIKLVPLRREGTGFADGLVCVAQKRTCGKK